MKDGRHGAVLEEFLAELPPEWREPFREVGRCAMALGYTPKRTKTRHPALDFSKSRVKRTILKLERYDNGVPANGPGIRLKFYASPAYSTVFRNGVQRVIEEFGGKYTGCYGCGRCAGEPQGYRFRYPDGREIFRCGSELIRLPQVRADDVDEIKELLRVQDAYFLAQA